MKAVAKVRREPGIEVVDLEPDPMGDTEVRIRTKAASICGSDLGFYSFTPSYQKFAKVPVTMGHEFVGEVSEVGKDVHSFKPGDRVGVESVIYCGTCRYCRSGMTNICKDFKVFGMHVNGGFAEFVTVDQKLLHRIPESLGYKAAGTMEPLSVVVNAIGHVARQDPWRNAAVIGPGPLGLLSAEVIGSKGVSDILVVGVNVDATRLRLAEGLGYPTMNSEVEDPSERTANMTDGYGFDITVVAAGAGDALRTALKMTSKGGQVIVLGIFPDEVSLPISDAVRRQISIAGSYGSASSHYEQAIQLLSQGKVRSEKIVTHQFGLERAQEAFETARSKSGCKVEFVIS